VGFHGLAETRGTAQTSGSRLAHFKEARKRQTSVSTHNAPPRATAEKPSSCMRSHHLLALFRRPASARPALALRHRGVAVLSPLAFDSTTGISAPHTDHATKPSRKAKRFDLHHAIDHDIEQLLNVSVDLSASILSGTITECAWFA
jgi:hypothetical protein